MVDTGVTGGGLDERGREILRLIVSEYIRSGEPIGSRTVSKMMQRRLSPATVRNIMADLEEAGFLIQPHTSAGRVPSDTGYRFYVEGLGHAAKPTRSAEDYINQALAGASTPEAMMSTACHLLSDISHNVGIVIAPPLEISAMQHIEFVGLGGEKILVILVSQSGIVQQKLIRVKDGFSQDQLTRAGNYLVERFSGSTLPEIRRELVQMMREERLQYDRLLAHLLESWSESLDEEGTSAEFVYVQGTGNILSKVDFRDMARIEELFRLFEEKDSLVKILNECLPSYRDERVQIMIGSELGAPCMQGLTFITSPYGRRDGSAGCLGIIGPTRMEYRKGISVVGYVADVFDRMISA